MQSTQVHLRHKKWITIWRNGVGTWTIAPGSEGGAVVNRVELVPRRSSIGRRCNGHHLQVLETASRFDSRKSAEAHLNSK